MTREALFSYYKKYGYNPHGLGAISAEASGWEATRAHGAVAYLEIGRTWLASEPLAAEADLAVVTAEFLEYAASRRCAAAFLPVTDRFAGLTARLELDSIPIGMSPYFDLELWSPAGRKGHTLRKELRYARQAGVTVECMSGSSVPRAEFETLRQAWAGTRRTTTFAWLFSTDAFEFPDYKTAFLARAADGRLVGALSTLPMPAREACYFKDLQRHPEAPKGVSDLLFVTAFEHLKAQGVRYVTPATVPIQGIRDPQAQARGNHRGLLRAMELVARYGEAVYSFAGLYRFKERLAPTWWEHEYAMARPHPLAAVRFGWAVARAIAPEGVAKALLQASWGKDRSKDEAKR